MQSQQNSDDLRAQIAGLAYSYFLEEGQVEGRDLDHWLRAERALKGPAEPQTPEFDSNHDGSRAVTNGELHSIPPRTETVQHQASATRETIRRQATAFRPAPRRSARPVERSDQPR